MQLNLKTLRLARHCIDMALEKCKSSKEIARMQAELLKRRPRTSVQCGVRQLSTPHSSCRQEEAQKKSQQKQEEAKHGRGRTLHFSIVQVSAGTLQVGALPHRQLSKGADLSFVVGGTVAMCHRHVQV